MFHDHFLKLPTQAANFVSPMQSAVYNSLPDNTLFSKEVLTKLYQKYLQDNKLKLPNDLKSIDGQIGIMLETRLIERFPGEELNLALDKIRNNKKSKINYVNKQGKLVERAV